MKSSLILSCSSLPPICVSVPALLLTGQFASPSEIPLNSQELDSPFPPSCSLAALSPCGPSFRLTSNVSINSHQQKQRSCCSQPCLSNFSVLRGHGCLLKASKCEPVLCSPLANAGFMSPSNHRHYCSLNQTRLSCGVTSLCVVCLFHLLGTC